MRLDDKTREIIKSEAANALGGKKRGSHDAVGVLFQMNRKAKHRTSPYQL